MIKIESTEVINHTKKTHHYKCACCAQRKKSKELGAYELDTNGKHKDRILLCDPCVKAIEENDIADKGIIGYVAFRDCGFSQWVLRQPSNRDKPWYKKAYGTGK